MPRHFKLHHKKHTGKLIHHRHTSYWALVLLVMVSGAFTLFIDRTVRAETLQVSATVPAPIPSTAAAFHAKFTMLKTGKSSVTLTGTCPVITPAVIIVLYSGSTLLGSGTCQPDGTFSIAVTLQPGEQTIIAEIITITGQAGLSSDPVTITYTPPTPTPAPTPESPSRPTTPSSNNSYPRLLDGTGSIGSTLLMITTTRPFFAYRPNIPASFEARFNGGSLPYTVTVAWGDGGLHTQKITNHDIHSFTHVYLNSTTSPLSITLTDSHGSSLTRYYAVVNLVPHSDATGITPAGLLDRISSGILDTSLVLYAALLACLIYLWRYEHTHYRQRVGVPTHYHWQHKKGRHH